MSKRELWEDAHTGKRYLKRLTRETNRPLYEGERLTVELIIGEGLSLQDVLVLDDVEEGDRYVVYSSASLSRESFLCPIERWTGKDCRFKKVVQP